MISSLVGVDRGTESCRVGVAVGEVAAAIGGGAGASRFLAVPAGVTGAYLALAFGSKNSQSGLKV